MHTHISTTIQLPCTSFKGQHPKNSCPKMKGERRRRRQIGFCTILGSSSKSEGIEKLAKIDRPSSIYPLTPCKCTPATSQIDGHFCIHCVVTSDRSSCRYGVPVYLHVDIVCHYRCASINLLIFSLNPAHNTHFKSIQHDQFNARNSHNGLMVRR